MNLNEMLVNLSQKRPVFHSEADFQHALAWEIHNCFSDCAMRLEFKPPHIKSRIYADVWISNSSSIAAIELKYKTRRLSVKVANETFDLLNQSAQDIGRYDFIKDIQRLEQITSGKKDIKGYAILLTNDSSYWSEPRGMTVDANFRINEGRTLSGELCWGDKASDGTMRGREKPILLKGVYNVIWNDYSELTGSTYNKFRYLLIEIN